MSEPIPATDYVNLGRAIQVLLNPRGTPANLYESQARVFWQYSQRCGFEAAFSASKQYEKLQLPEKNNVITDVAAGQMTSIANTVAEVLYGEAQKRQTLALAPCEVSNKLRGVGGKLLTDAQQALLRETIRCIECGAYRAAAVMGWNLAYDYMRRWVFDNQLCKLNKGLARVCPKKKVIALYGDFFDKDAPNERNVIDAMVHQDSGPIIGGELYDYLVQYLRDRNKYAHASEKDATAFKTNGYIEHLIDIIVAPPFA